MKIIITGGHLSPALALIDKLKEIKRIQIVYIGKKYNLDSEKSLSLEYQEIKKRGFPFYHLNTGRLTRIVSFTSIINLLKFPFGLLQSFSILKKEKPDLIFSFGGYLGLPVALCGFILNIPIYIHEQTINPGLTNRILSSIAKKVFVSFPQTKNLFPKNKVVVTGNLIRREVFTSTKKPFTIKKTKPVIYVTGGSLGSHSINILIEKILPQLLKKYIVIHQIGGVKQYHDFERMKAYQNPSYFPVKHFFLDEIGYVYQTADLVIGRAGANTFFELLALKKPVILVPLPWSANQEQQKHARLFKQWQLGEIFDQNDNHKRLLSLIDKMIENLNFYRNNFSRLPINFLFDAEEKIIKEIF
jgi:UDP-N-acetylglucosamine--N-acetylmuramyl-(pentapeptide) pyrophosphoryl-undecaprenol N-acetylglucosamine transferase